MRGSLDIYLILLLMDRLLHNLQRAIAQNSQGICTQGHAGFSPSTVRPKQGRSDSGATPDERIRLRGRAEVRQNKACRKMKVFFQEGLPRIS